MKKSTFIAICALFCGTVLSLSAAQKPAINIGNIVNKSGVNLDTNTFVTRLSTAIVNTRQFDVIESDRIDEIIDPTDTRKPIICNERGVTVIR